MIESPSPLTSASVAQPADRSTSPAAAQGKLMNWERFFQNYRTPDFVPGFTILNKLGSGVFGEVYKAKRTSIGKLYAIKFLRLQDERLQEQVLRELEGIDALAQVDHPNLVSIEDRGEVCGIPYIIMGYAGDQTLKHFLEGGAMSVEKALPLFQQVLAGVEALHQHSIIHFDLKPANIFIRGAVARVGDYGLSKLMSESRATLSMGRGTPYYMAPEMLHRRGDARSDVYSLGVLLFEMLCGQVPFKGDTEWEILKRHETEHPAIPASIPSSLKALLTQALDKDPARRFATAGAMRQALDKLMKSPMPAGGQSAAKSPSSNSPLQRSEASVAAPPPAPVAALYETPSARAGAAVGRIAATSRVTIDKVRGEVQDVLQKLRVDTKDAVSAAKREWTQGLAHSLNGKRKLTFKQRRAERKAARAEKFQPQGLASHAQPVKRRSWIGKAFRGLYKTLSLPISLVVWSLRNVVQAAVVVAIVVALCYALHLGLEELIL